MDSNNPVPITLPPHISKPSHQLSGHEFGKGKTKFGLLKDSRSSKLLKPIIDIRGKREYEFYQTVWSAEDVKLQSFVPKFYGLVTIENIPFIQLEDITERITNPSNMDIKIGVITYDPAADSNKIREETSKYPWQKETGFRICGIRVYDPKKVGNYIHVDKHVTRQQKPEDIPDTLDIFLGSHFNPLTARLTLLERYLSKLQLLHEWFETININNLKFLSSSLLFVYSSDNQIIDLKMIDFAHVFPNTSSKEGEKCKDDNYLFGLNKLIYFLTILLDSLKNKASNLDLNNGQLALN